MTLGDDKTADISEYEQQYEDVLKELNKLELLDQARDQLFDKHDVDEDRLITEHENSIKYRVGVRKRLGKIKGSYKSAGNISEKTTKSKGHIGLPSLNCAIFDGTSPNKWDFWNFLCQFQNCLKNSGEIDNETKFTYLLSFLDKRPRELVAAMPLGNDTYDEAMRILRNNYLDIKAIKRYTYNKILDTQLSEDCDYEALRTYLEEVQLLLFELEKQGSNFKADHPGRDLMAHIIVRNLPGEFKKVLFGVLGHNYPQINDILDNYVEVIGTLEFCNTTGKRVEAHSSTEHHDRKPKPKKLGSREHKMHEYNSDKMATLQNFHTEEAKSSDKGAKSVMSVICKFCSDVNHSTRRCTKYADLESRRRRLSELGLCQLCTTHKHDTSKCPGKEDRLAFKCSICKKFKHNTALCDKPKDQN